MYLVIDNHPGSIYRVFTNKDPRVDGCTVGTLVEDVVVKDSHLWTKPNIVVGRDPENKRLYRLFNSLADVNKTRFIAVGGSALVYDRWTEFQRPSP
jgi:hypothetical protein